METFVLLVLGLLAEIVSGLFYVGLFALVCLICGLGLHTDLFTYSAIAVFVVAPNLFTDR